MGQRSIHVGKEIKCWVLYAFLSFITTALILLDSSSTSYIRDIAKFVQRLAIVMMVAYICEREGSIRFGLRLMAVTAFACAISVLMVTDDIRAKLSISSDASLSANDIGAIMSFGCFSIVYAWGKRAHSNILLSAVKTAGFICCLIVIFLAGSRKSIGAVAVMLMVLLVLCGSDYIKHLRVRKTFTILIIGIAAYLIITEFLLPYADQTNLYRRLLGSGAAGASESDELRKDLYRWAFDSFLEHPLFGLGFNQYVKRYGNYTHSTYAEPLACSGLIGLLYLYPYYSMVRKQLYLISRCKRGSYARLKQKEILAYMCMFLFVGIGIPFMYKDIPCILLGTIIASQAISFSQLKVTGELSSEY